MPASLLSLLALLPQTAPGLASEATGLEWMIFASVLIPAVLIGVLIYAGLKRTV